MIPDSEWRIGDQIITLLRNLNVFPQLSQVDIQASAWLTLKAVSLTMVLTLYEIDAFDSSGVSMSNLDPEFTGLIREIRRFSKGDIEQLEDDYSYVELGVLGELNKGSQETMKRLRLSPSSVSIMVGYLQFIFTCSNLQSLRLDGGEDDEEEEGHFEFLVPRNCSSN